MKKENELQAWLRATKRVPWSAAKPQLKIAGIDPSIGWEMTIAHLSTWSVADRKYAIALDAIKKLFKAHIYIGEKLILWHRIDAVEIASFSELLLKLTPLIGANFSKTFPLPVPSAALKSCHEHQPELASVEDHADRTVLVFCSKRTFNLREEIMPQRFSQADRTWLEQYQQVVGYKKVEFQAYDVVWLDKKTGLLEFRIDAPDGLSKDDTRACRNALVEKFYDSLAAFAKGAIPAATQIDFFPAIDKMYKATKEGSVFELYFIATTGSNNFGKMRNKVKDLRTEAFHKAGASTVGITPYRLGIMWHQLSRIFHPELHLPGSLKLFATGKVQPLHAAFVRNCISHDDYNLVSKRFLTYL